MFKKLLVVMGLVVIVGSWNGYSYASEEQHYIHFGFSGVRIASNHQDVSKFIQLNGSLVPSEDCEDVKFSDLKKRLYVYLGTNRDRDYITGIGYYGLIGKFGLQIGDYWDRKEGKDYFCYGLYADVTVFRKLWEIIKVLGDEIYEKVN